MFHFTKITGSVWLRSRAGRSLRQTFASAFNILPFSRESETGGSCRDAALGLMRNVMESGSPLDGRDLDAFRTLLSDEHSPSEIGHLVGELRRVKPVSPAEAAPFFAGLPESEQLQLIRSLMILAISGGYPQRGKALIAEFAELLGLPAAELQAITAEVESAQTRRRQIIRSGAGVLAAVIVIGVFILTATLLRSVIFGLIAAYALLPVEKYFERRLRAHRGIGYCFFCFSGWLTAPLRSLAGKIRKYSKTESEDRSPETEVRRANRRIITQAVGMTSALVLLIVLLVVIALSSVTNHYVHNLRNSVKNWAAQDLLVQPGAGETAATARDSGTLAENSAEELIGQMQYYLDRLRSRFENLRLVRFGLDKISALLRDEGAQRELAGILLRRTGGIFSFTALVVGAIGAILADLLLTTFFFLLFLAKLAEFCSGNNGTGRQSEYLVRTVFNGNWLPGANEETVSEAQRIIGDVMDKLRTWVRGYLTLMTVDAIVYTTMFFFLGVPYFPVLGILAGCGILLPYIGPILSAVLTLLVTLAAGGNDVSSFQLLAIIATYLVYNGIIEQFILYPAVIGESLGLTTLETIIVVLLGAVFAGIPGMILAIPATSVMKYLVPQIYKCWTPPAENREKTT